MKAIIPEISLLCAATLMGAIPIGNHGPKILTWKEYTVNLDIGPPPQRFALFLDTGNVDSWIPSTRCDPALCPLTRFDEILSFIFIPTNQNTALVYGNGNSTVTIGVDTVSIGGAIISNQIVGLASKVYGAKYCPVATADSGSELSSSTTSLENNYSRYIDLSTYARSLTFENNGETLDADMPLNF
ncbi:aspartic peptidase domain-containing protein [Phycomyces blakesleeanus]|uniref:Aspartic peptidase domain-containing protein n=1 Tax=Phycomyces blakesleeanus TaxID=4837 RepID=A0ABR3AYT2_PHYBL